MTPCHFTYIKNWPIFRSVYTTDINSSSSRKCLIFELKPSIERSRVNAAAYFSMTLFQASPQEPDVDANMNKKSQRPKDKVTF